MREANIPLEGKAMGPDSSSDIILTGLIVMWNDIDLYHALRDFTTDPVSFPTDEVGAFIDELVNHRSAVYTDITDPGANYCPLPDRSSSTLHSHS